MENKDQEGGGYDMNVVCFFAGCAVGVFVGVSLIIIFTLCNTAKLTDEFFERNAGEDEEPKEIDP